VLVSALFGRTRPEEWTRQAAQVAAQADGSRLEVKQTDQESDVTTVEGAGLAIAEWPSTVRHLLRLRPSSRLILGQFVSLLVSTSLGDRQTCAFDRRHVWFAVSLFHF